MNHPEWKRETPLWTKDIGTSLAILSAILGAGFASGREVLLFFTRFGKAAPWGCTAAALTLSLLLYVTLRRAEQIQAYDLPGLCTGVLGRRAALPALILQGAMLCISAGAMVSSMAELFALALPLRGAYAVGFFAALYGGMRLCCHAKQNLTRLSFLLIPLCLLLYGVLWFLPAHSPHTGETPIELAITMAVQYAAMNAALAGGFVCENANGLSQKRALRISALTGGMFLCLLLLVQGVLSRHYEQIGEAALPAVLLSGKLGALGYWLCIVTFASAVITTLIAQMKILSSMFERRMKGQQARWAALFLIGLCALFGFERLTGKGYPLMGAACACVFILLLRPKKCFQPMRISR